MYGGLNGIFTYYYYLNNLMKLDEIIPKFVYGIFFNPKLDYFVQFFEIFFEIMK